MVPSEVHSKRRDDRGSKKRMSEKANGHKPQHSIVQCFTMTRHSLSESIVTHIQSHTQPCSRQGPDNQPSPVGEGVHVSGMIWCRCHYKADCTDH